MLRRGISPTSMQSKITSLKLLIGKDSAASCVKPRSYARNHNPRNFQPSRPYAGLLLLIRFLYSTQFKVEINPVALEFYPLRPDKRTFWKQRSPLRFKNLARILNLKKKERCLSVTNHISGELCAVDRNYFKSRNHLPKTYCLNPTTIRSRHCRYSE